MSFVTDPRTGLQLLELSHVWEMCIRDRYLPRPVGVLFRVAPALALRRAISSWTASKVSRLTMPSWWRCV